MIQPKPLTKNDKVVLIAPAGYVQKEKIENVLAAIKRLGLVPVLGANALNTQNYLAGSDIERAKDINNAFLDKEIKGIIALRGGYGSMRILDMLDYQMIKNNPKIFVGYSDITAIHLAINKKCDLVTYHGPMACVELINPKIDQYTKAYFNHYIFGKNNAFFYAKKFMSIKTLTTGNFKGTLIGGNLTTVVATLGTKYEIDTYNKVLFLEEINECTYKIDRLITQLKLSGKLSNLKAVILGHFTNCTKNNDELLDIFKEAFENIPCIYNMPSGHSLPNITLPIGGTIIWKK